MTQWTNPHAAGLLPIIFNELDPRPAKQQAQDCYAHGGGWSPMAGFTLQPNGLEYAGDPALAEVSRTTLHGKETIILYECAFVAIIQADATFEVARMD